MKKRSISVVTVLGIIINLLIPFNVSASTAIPDYLIWKADFLMGKVNENSRDVYGIVSSDSFYYRDVYNQCIDSKLYNFVQIETAQWCVDGIDFVTNPEYFYDIILTDILQNRAIDILETGDYQASISSNIYTIGKGIMGGTSSAYNTFLNKKITSQTVSKDVAAKLNKEIKANTKFKSFLEEDLDFIETVCTVGKSYTDALTEVLSYLEVSNYSKQQVDILRTMYNLTDNKNLRTSLSKQINVYEKYTDPSYVFDTADISASVATETFKNLFMFSITKGSETILSSVVGSTALAPVVATWEIGTAVTDLLFNTQDSATAYLTIVATVEVEDALQAAMKTLRNQYIQNKSVYNAQLCLEAYDMTLANAYSGTNIAQEFGYAITKGGLALNLWYGDKAYENFEDIGDDCRDIIKIRYFDYPRLAMQFYGIKYYNTNDIRNLSSLSPNIIEDVIDDDVTPIEGTTVEGEKVKVWRDVLVSAGLVGSGKIKAVLTNTNTSETQEVALTFSQFFTGETEVVFDVIVYFHNYTNAQYTSLEIVKATE